MTQQTHDLAIMFADVSDSSALYKRLGNLRAKRRLDTIIKLMMKLTGEHGGVVVKTIGDEIMTRFDAVEDACRAAIAIQQHETIRSDSDRLAVRIGLAFGPTLADEDDVFGDTVNDAACVTHIARANQIVLTQGAADLLDGELRNECHIYDRIKLKGELNPTAIYRMDWEHSYESHSATRVISIDDLAPHLEQPQLTLKLREREVHLKPEQTPFVLGRDMLKAHLQIDSGLASRDHCHIIFRRGKYVLVDHSTNGTYVSHPAQADIYLRREELPLFGSGSISLGEPVHRAGDWLIHYQQ